MLRGDPALIFPDRQVADNSLQHIRVSCKTPPIDLDRSRGPKLLRQIRQHPCMTGVIFGSHFPQTPMGTARGPTTN